MDLSVIGFAETATPQHIMLIRILIAAILGGAIGYERESHAAAGFRTHILIATAACLFALLAFEIFHLSDVVETGRADPIRAIAHEHKVRLRDYLRGIAVEHQARDPDRLAAEFLILIDGAITVAKVLNHKPAAREAQQLAKQLLSL